MNNFKQQTNQLNRFLLYSVALICLMITGQVFAASQDTIGTMASNITDSFTAITKLITAGSYLAGLAFAIGAIMKFKQHKDNPTQIPIGTPIALIFIAAALLFLPVILQTTGATLFGSSLGSDSVGGPTGIIFSVGS